MTGPQMYKFQFRNMRNMKKQVNNLQKMDSNDSEVDEHTLKKMKRMIIRMSNKITY
jgi:hypothetical protein